MRDFENPNPLMYGLNPCPQNHIGPNGKPVRRQRGGDCWACYCGMPDGPFTHDFGDLLMQTPDARIKYHTAEEKRKARVEAQMRWNKKEPEKLKGYQAAYFERNREERAATARAKYEENREAITARNRAYYHANKEKIRIKSKQYYDTHKEEMTAKQREYYYKRKAKNDAILQESQSQTISGVGSEQTSNSIS